MKTNRLMIVAVGGQGNLLASKVLGDAALLSGVPVRMSEIHGMAQRGGVVESSVVFGDAQSTIISDGEVDVLLGFEPAETLRALGKCNKDTVVITNLAPLPPFTAAIGRGVYPEIAAITGKIKKKIKDVTAFDAMALAKEAGSPMAMNIVLLGALIKKNNFSLSKDSILEAIKGRTKGKFLDINLKAFELGYSKV